MTAEWLKCHSALILTKTLLRNENSAACYSALLQPIYSLEYTDWSLVVSSGEEDGCPGSWTTPESWLSASVAEIRMKNRKRSRVNTTQGQHKQSKNPKPCISVCITPGINHISRGKFSMQNYFCQSSLFFNPVNSKALDIKSCSSPSWDTARQATVDCFSGA